MLTFHKNYDQNISDSWCFAQLPVANSKETEKSSQWFGVVKYWKDCLKKKYTNLFVSADTCIFQRRDASLSSACQGHLRQREKVKDDWIRNNGDT